jgi:hypothetical protein
VAASRPLLSPARRGFYQLSQPVEQATFTRAEKDEFAKIEL